MDTSPINYKLTFEPDLKKFTFHGLESISIDCKKSVNVITMNCAELKIKSCIVIYTCNIVILLFGEITQPMECCSK